MSALINPFIQNVGKWPIIMHERVNQKPIRSILDVFHNLGYASVIIDQQITHPAFICSGLAMETQEQSVKFIQS